MNDRLRPNFGGQGQLIDVVQLTIILAFIYSTFCLCASLANQPTLPTTALWWRVVLFALSVFACLDVCDGAGPKRRLRRARSAGARLNVPVEKFWRAGLQLRALPVEARQIQQGHEGPLRRPERREKEHSWSRPTVSGPGQNAF